jgi:hypothetical protein
MKKNYFLNENGNFSQKFFLLPIILLLFTISCDKSEIDVLEIAIDDSNKCIQNERNEIDFNFCLINVDGIPSTSFRANENFNFSFSFTNDTKDTIVVTTEFIKPDFLRVFRSSDKENMGRPWTGVWCEFSLRPQEIVLAPGNNKTILSAWLSSENSPSDLFPLCTDTALEPLPKGEFYTEIKSNFHYAVNGKKTIIDDLSYKINFKIE